MEHTQLIRFTAMLIMTAVLCGCAATQPTVPTAVLYDQDHDKFSVEVQPVPQGQALAYPEELGFVTLINGERHEGLIPARSAYNQTPQRKSDLWLGPYWVKFDKNSKWRILLLRMKLPDIPDQNKPLDAECQKYPYVYDNYVPQYPVYQIQIVGAHIFLTR